MESNKQTAWGGWLGGEKSQKSVIILQSSLLGAAMLAPHCDSLGVAADGGGAC